MPLCRAPKQVLLPEPEAVGAIKALNLYYEAKVVPAEKRHQFPLFYTPQYTATELEGKPIILLLGQYSVGKTSMIEYLLGGCYPGAEIGPEPTTDFFAHIQYADQPVTIEGPTLINDRTYPFKGLEMFGNNFLSRLKSTNFPSDLLKHMSIIDTPGILAGQKQTDSRGYNFAHVVSYLADRVDKIILLFDAGKVDISDEYKNVIQSLDGHSEKVLIVLNKSDSVPPKELIRVRGALMWNLGKILTAPEVPKVYIGSFWKFQPANVAPSETVLEDAEILITEICDLVNTYRARRVNDVVKRAKNLRIHCLIMDAAVRKRGMFASPSRLLTMKFMAPILVEVEKQHRFVHADMPTLQDFCMRAAQSNVAQWKKIDKKIDAQLCQFLNEDITRIIAAIKKEKPENIDYQLAQRITKPDKKTRRQESPKRSKREVSVNESRSPAKKDEHKSKSEKKGDRKSVTEKKKSEQRSSSEQKKRNEKERSKRSPPRKKSSRKEVAKIARKQDETPTVQKTQKSRSKSEQETKEETKKDADKKKDDDDKKDEVDDKKKEDKSEEKKVDNSKDEKHDDDKKADE